jgi:metal-responsive CopG/Arc/MetJ family transcriptional regulator
MLEMARDRKPINLTLDPEVVQKLDAWIEKQPIRAGRSAVVEAAIKLFLEGQETKHKGKG